MKLRLLIFAILLAMGARSANAQLLETTASINISRDSIMIGDTLTMSLDVVKDISSIINIPSFIDNKMSEFIEIIEGPKIDTLEIVGRAHPLKISYTITSFDAGRYHFDSLPIMLGDREPFDTLWAMSNRELVVNTFEIDTTKHRPMDILPIIETPYSWAEFKADIIHNIWWIVGSLVALVIIVLGILWFMRLRRSKANENKYALLPAHLEAINSLEALRAKKLWQSGRVKEYYTDVTDALRIYLKRRYDIPAMEMSSSEIIAKLKLQHPEKRLVDSMCELFELSDLVKFAELVPDGEECETAYFDAYYYIEQTKLIEVEELEINNELKN